ncbi:MAG TPA: rod shape-determining protein RodA [Vicinamibacterales bacterium]|jgi:rod shape determining protein RodA
MFERRLFHHIDWLTIIVLGALCVMGVTMIYSTTHDGPNSTLYVKQIYAIAIGVLAFVACLVIDYRVLAEYSLVFYVLVVALLVGVLLFGTSGGGARRWIPLPFFALQPSEFAKICVALTLAKLFEESRRGSPSATDLGVGAAITLVPFLLIAKEPDLGTAITLLTILLGIAFLAGMRMRLLGIVLIVAIVAAPVAWRYALKDYQKNRLSTFLDPELDPRGAGYQQIQARISVGSGGAWGQGFLKGTQGQLRFLPVAWNDFVFSVYAEEQGLVGVIVALGLYLFVIVRALETARLARDRLGAYLVLGLLSAFTFQVMYNITMSAGLVPVKGLTLPLMSSGGSSMIATLAGFGLIVNVRMRRFTN